MKIVCVRAPPPPLYTVQENAFLYINCRHLRMQTIYTIFVPFTAPIPISAHQCNFRKTMFTSAYSIFGMRLLHSRFIIHRHDEYNYSSFVPGSLLRSTKECQLGYFLGVPGSLLNFSVIRNSSRKILLVV